MKVIVKERYMGSYHLVEKDVFQTKKSFIQVVMDEVATDGMEHLSPFQQALVTYIGGNGNLSVFCGKNEYFYKKGNIFCKENGSDAYVYIH